MALLAWVKSRKMFLKIQEGTGGNLLAEVGLLFLCSTSTFNFSLSVSFSGSVVL